MTSLPARAVRDLKALVSSPVALVLTLLFAGASATTLAFFPRESSTVLNITPVVEPGAQGQSELERFMSTAPRVPLVIASGGAKVLIVKFNDYQCPACGQSYFSYKPIFAKYEASNPGAIRVVMKDFPLSPKCNPSLAQELHSAACEAAVAVRLARQNNHGEAMEEWLYSNQKGMTPASVKQAAKDVGQVSDFDAKYAATLELVKGDIAMARQLNVSQTPTFFINGVKVDGAWNPQFFDQALAYELKRAEPK
jgi:protein-disulfide isomerase